MKNRFGAKRRKHGRQEEKDDAINKEIGILAEAWPKYQGNGDLFLTALYQREQQFSDSHSNLKIWRRSALIKFSQSNNIFQHTSFDAEPFPLPTLSKKDPLISDRWLSIGLEISKLEQELQLLWQNAPSTNIEYVFGSLLLSSTLYAGVSNMAVLNTLAQHLLRNKAIIIDDSKILMMLEIESERFGNYWRSDVDSRDRKDPGLKKLSRSRIFIPDKITAIWIQAFQQQELKSKKTTKLNHLRCINKVLSTTNTSLRIEQILHYGNYHWQTLPNTQIPQAWVSIALDTQLNCCLEPFRFLHLMTNLQLNINQSEEGHDLQEINPQLTSLEINAPINKEPNDLDIDLKSLNRGLKKGIEAFGRSRRQQEAYSHILNSLYQRHISDLAILAIGFINYMLTDYQLAKPSSINTYRSAFIPAWLSLGEDINLKDLSEHEWYTIYKQLENHVIENNKKVSQTLDTTIRHFHRYMVCYHEAPSIVWKGEPIEEVVRARYISPAAYQSILLSLEVNLKNQEHELEMLRAMIILAYRCGLIVSEITGLKIKDFFYRS